MYYRHVLDMHACLQGNTCMQTKTHVSNSLFANICIHVFVQFLRKCRCGLPAFRRLVGRPILRDAKLQDVVFAGGQDVWAHSHTSDSRSVKTVCLQADMVRELTHKRQSIGRRSTSWAISMSMTDDWSEKICLQCETVRRQPLLHCITKIIS